ncbi:MAG: hypothetical protein H0V44_02970 [Planctomycetes bacterium]|nr:hypothetical protein [Planctomycetota bacterium]
MVTKAQLLDSMRHETHVIKHLVGKIHADKLEYRPSPAQRSTIELLRYLTTCASVSATFALTGTWEHAAAADKRASHLRLEDIPKAMDDQLAAIDRQFAGIDDAELGTRPSKMPWGAPGTLGEVLMNQVLKLMVAYRMQLFLYAKACGAEIGTANCWGGMDAKKPGT